MASTLEELAQDPEMRAKVQAARKMGQSYEQIENYLRVKGVLAEPQAASQPGIFSMIGRALEGPAGLQQAVQQAPQVLRENAPLIGQVALPLLTGGESLPLQALAGVVGGVGGSAIKRGGMPTKSDVGTAVAGEVMPAIPGAAKAVSRFAEPFVAPGIAASRAAASRFGIPLGVGEMSANANLRSMFEGLAKNPFSSGVMGRAGRAQSESILGAGERIGEKFGGAMAVPDFAKRAAAQIKAALKYLPPDKAAKLGEAAKFGQETIEAATLAHQLARNPKALAPIMQRVGTEGMNNLRAAWWTAALEGATQRMGPNKGLINPARVWRTWDKLGEAGQKALFGARVKELGGFMDVLRQAKAAEMVGTKTHLPKYFQYTMGGVLLGRTSEWGKRAAELLSGEAALPWFAAHVLANGPPGAISTVLAPFIPSAERAAVQEAGQSVNP